MATQGPETEEEIRKRILETATDDLSAFSYEQLKLALDSSILPYENQPYDEPLLDKLLSCNQLLVKDYLEAFITADANQNVAVCAKLTSSDKLKTDILALAFVNLENYITSFIIKPQPTVEKAQEYLQDVKFYFSWIFYFEPSLAAKRPASIQENILSENSKPNYINCKEIYDFFDENLTDPQNEAFNTKVKSITENLHNTFRQATKEYLENPVAYHQHDWFQKCYNIYNFLIYACAREDTATLAALLQKDLTQYLLLSEQGGTARILYLLNIICRNNSASVFRVLLEHQEICQKILPENWYEALRTAISQDPEKNFEMVNEFIAVAYNGLISAELPVVIDIERSFKKADAFRKGSGDKIFSDFPAASSMPEVGELIEGPKIKNQMTFNLEYIVQSLLKDPESVTLSLQGENYIATVGGRSFYLNEMLQKADLTQLSLSPEDFLLYEHFLETDSTIKPSLISNSQDLIADRETLMRLAEKTSLEKLHYAELAAINIYTQPSFFSDMNALLRDGRIVSNPSDVSLVKEILLHCVMATSGLSHTPDQLLDNFTYRYDRELPEEVLQSRIQSAESLKGSPAVAEESAFFSFAIGNPAPNFEIRCSSRTICYGLQGKDVTPISFYQHEKEYLIPPTQMRWLAHEEIQGEHYFFAVPVNTPIGLKADAGPGQVIPREEDFFTQIIETMRKVITEEIDTSEPWVAKKIAECKAIKHAAIKLQKNTDLSFEQKFYAIMPLLASFNHQNMPNISEEYSMTAQVRSSLYLFKRNLQKLQKFEEKLKDSLHYKNALPELTGAMKAVNSLLQEPFGTGENIPLEDDKYYQACPWDWVLSMPDGTAIQRPNHGLAHTLRTAQYVPIVAQYLIESNPERFQFSDQEIKRMQFILLFFIVGRKSEIGHSMNAEMYDEFRTLSAEAFKKYCREHSDEATSLFESDNFESSELFQKYYQLLKIGTPPPGETSKGIDWVLYMAHNLDLLRCRGPDEIEEIKTKFAEVIPDSKKVDALFNYAQALIAQTGDRILGSQYYNKEYDLPIFKACSTSPDACLRAMSNIEPPLLSVPKRVPG